MPEPPPPSRLEREMEAAKAWGYQWSEWQAESTVHRARILAHETLTNIRTNYLHERERISAEKKSKREASSKDAGRAAMNASFGL
jgi:vacuolar-type H+-ATPase subunit H